MIPITEGSRPTLLSIHIKVSEFSPLNSLIKLIFMILTRGVAHSDQDPKLRSFSCMPLLGELHTHIPK